MDLGNFFKDAAQKTSKLVKTEFDKQIELKQLQAEQTKQICAEFPIDSGYQQINASPNSRMFQRQDGTIYFNTNFSDYFLLIGYEWSGPRYETITDSESNTQGEETTKGKSGKMFAGAAIGTLLMPGVGTAVGAAIGAGSKKKKAAKTQTSSHSIQRQSELLTPATLKLKSCSNNELFSIVIGCNTLIDSKIKGFRIYQEETINAVSRDATDALKGIKALKELLDMGAITQEEFEQKKEQLLK